MRLTSLLFICIQLLCCVPAQPTTNDTTIALAVLELAANRIGVPVGSPTDKVINKMVAQIEIKHPVQLTLSDKVILRQYLNQYGDKLPSNESFILAVLSNN